MKEEKIKTYFDNVRAKDFEDAKKAYAHITKAMEEFTIKLFQEYDDEIVSRVACSMGLSRVEALPEEVKHRISNGAWRAIYEGDYHSSKNQYVKCPCFGFGCLAHQQEKR